MTAETPSTAQVELANIRELMKRGDMAAASEKLTVLSETASENYEVFFLKAVCERHTNKMPQALETLQKLKTIRPGYGRAYQEEGHVFLAMGEKDKAVTAYRQAISYNGSLLASWRGLVNLLDNDSAQMLEEAKSQVFKLSSLPPELLSVRNMTAEGRYYDAERLCRHFLMKNKTHVEGMRLLADLGVKTNVLDDAEFILESAVEFEPHNNLARNDYVGVLYRRQKYELALKHAKILKDREPHNLDYEIGYANQCMAVGDYSPAMEIYERAIVAKAERPDLHLVYGHGLKTIGHIDPAISAYRNAYKARENFGDAYWSLANLKTYKFTQDEVTAMKKWEDDDGTHIEDRAHLNFALGKHYEDAAEFEASYIHYEKGNSLRQTQINYDSEGMSQRLKLQASICTSAFFEKHKGSGHPSTDPIFIVGLPRAGSTLLEQILASHSQIEGTLELPNIQTLSTRLDGRRKIDEPPRYPAILSDMDKEQLVKFGEAFINDTRIHRSDTPFFIDKMPNNFRHIGLIKLILPKAKIIDARRHPMACCFSGFKQLFASGQEFTYGLTEIGTYYRDYVELMDHWDDVLPGDILRVQYEDVVADTETQVRRILDYLELPFEQACLEFHKTERSVRTPSSEQVRQPIFKSGLEQWRNFEPWLDPLKNALGPDILKRYPI